MSAEKNMSLQRDQRISDDGDMNRKVNINSLDYDSLANILMLLPIPERIDMEKICTKWKEACQLAWYDIKKYKCELSIGRSYDNCFLTQSYLEKILLMCGTYLRELSLSNICNSSIMPFVGDHCQNLTSLECEFDAISLIYNVNHFVQAFEQLNKLQRIKIIVKNEYPNSWSLNLFEIINSLPDEIDEIHIFSNLLCPGKETVPMSIQKFKNLKKLTIHNLRLNKILVQEIAEKSTLVHLKIRPYVVHKDLSLFDKLVNLEYIDVSTNYCKCVYTSTRRPSRQVLYTIFRSCKNLKHLDLSYGDYDIERVPLNEWINFKHLQHLAISCKITPDLANTIVEYCKDLQHLKIRSSQRSVNKTAFKKLTELKNLECFILLGQVDLHEESIIAISNTCQKLTHLEIPNCTIVPSHRGEPLSSPSVLDELSKLQYLEHLRLCMATNLKDSTIIAIANDCKYLKVLEIQGCSAITESALTALTNLENLQKLNVSSLDISDSFITKFKGLKGLHCDNCKKLTDAGISQFIKNNPDLEIISVYGIENITLNLVIAADQATKNRTNGIILHIKTSKPSIIEASKSIIKSQWLVVDCI